MKKLFKILLLVTIFTFAICISSYAAGDVTVQEELIDGLFSNIESSDGTSYTIDVDGSKLISLLSSSLTGDTVSNNLYVKLPDTATKAVVTYSDNTTANLEIATTSEINYAICPVPVLKKINNVYYPAFLNSLKANNTSTNSGSVEFFADDSTSLGNITFSAKLNPDTFSGALIYIDSSSTDSYVLDSVNGDITISASYDRVMANGDCTIHVLLSSNIGETINLTPFGTLSYVGQSDKDSVYTYEYSAKILDETIFNNNIFCMFTSAENNILQVCEFNFEGDLIVADTPSENPDDSDNKAVISVKDSTSNIKLDATTGVVPDDTTLKVEQIKDGTRFEEIKSILGDVKFTVFNISLISNGSTIQPTGNVTISIPIPTGYDRDNLIAYRIDADGTKTDYSVKVDGDYAVIETNHFSDYILSEKVASVIDSNTDGTTNSSNTLDNEPKTGINNPVSSVITVLIIACIGLTVCIKKISK